LRNWFITLCIEKLRRGEYERSHLKRAALLIGPLMLIETITAIILIDLSFGFISLILRDFSLSSHAFYLEKGSLTLLFGKNRKNLRDSSYENKQNKPKTQVIGITPEGILSTLAKIT